MKQIIILVYLILLGCNRAETEIVVSTFADGKPKMVFYFSGEIDTLSYRKEVFYNSGRRNYIGNMVNGKKDGIWTWWYENGKEKDKCKYMNGFYTDTVYHWFKSGQLKQLEIVPQETVSADNSCSCNGTIIRYYESGKLKEKFSSIKGKFHGTYTRFEEDGGWSIKNYKDGIMWGPTIEHNIDSTTTIVLGQYRNGKESGEWQWFNKDSIIFQRAEYSDGEFSGTYIRYYSNGKIESEGVLKNGFRNGLFKFYNEKGELIGKETYRDGYVSD